MATSRCTAPDNEGGVPDRAARGWDSRSWGPDRLSNTGIHHQMVKLRECGPGGCAGRRQVAQARPEGGSMAAAISLVEAQAVAVLGLRASELGRWWKPPRPGWR